MGMGMEFSARRSRVLLHGLLVFLVVALGIVLAPSDSALATEADSGLQLFLSSSQADIKADDEVVFTLIGKNSSSQDIDHAAYKIDLPDGLKLMDGYVSEGDFGPIDSGAEATVQFKAKAKSDIKVASGVQQPVSNSGDAGTPAAGDSTVSVAVVAVSFVALVVLAFAFRRYKAMYVFMLAFVLAGSAVFATTARADEYAVASCEAEATCEITLFGKPATVKASVAYSYAEKEVLPADTMTRGEWIAKLLEGTDIEVTDAVVAPFTDIAGNKNEAAIKTAYARGFLPDDDAEFNPDAVATRDFVYSTAVLRAGFVADSAQLDAFDAADSKHPSLLAIAVDGGLVALDAQGKILPNDSFAASDTDVLLDRVKSLIADDSGEGDHCKITYRDDVTVVKGFERDGDSYLISTDTQLKNGDRIVLEPGDGQLEGAAGTISSVAQDGAKATVSVTPAEKLEDIYESIDISASNIAASLQYAEFSEGIELVDEPTATSLYDGRLDLPTFKLVMGEKTLGKYISGKMSVSVAPYINADFKWSIANGLERAKLGLGGDVGLNGTIKAETKNDVSIPLGKVPFEVSPGITVWLYLNIDVSVSGEVSLSITQKPYVCTTYSNGHLKFKGEVPSENTVIPSASLKLGIGPSASLNIMSFEMFDLKASIGALVKGSIVTRDTSLKCADVTDCAYLEVSAGTDTTWMKEAGLSLTLTLFDENNSPVKTSKHFENGEEVSECTYGKDTDSEGKDDDSGDDFEDDGSCYHPYHAGVSFNASYGREPSFDEPFSLAAGESLIVDAIDNDVEIDALWDSLEDYCSDTVLRRKDYDISTGELKGVWVMTPSCLSRTGNGLYVVKGYREVIEVLCGRQSFTATVHGDGKLPNLEKGTCDVITRYPLRLSRRQLKLKVGEKTVLSYKLDIASQLNLPDYDVGDVDLLSDNQKIKAEMLEDGTIQVEALSSGSCTLWVDEGLFYRLCYITVE